MQSRHKTFNLNLPNPTSKQKYSLIVNSDFDSGNLESAAVTAIPSYQLAFSKNNQHPYSLTVTPALEPFNSNYSYKVSSKTFFHFSVRLKNGSVQTENEAKKGSKKVEH